jgi:hypothetical protein
MKLEIEYTPPGPVAAAFMRSDAFVRGIRGPVGSGKSTSCVIEIMRRAEMQAPSPNGRRRTRWAVIRNTYPELKTTTIKTWHEVVPQNVGRWQAEGPPTHHLLTDTLDAEVMFLALDRPEDIRKLLSLELTGGWINEARFVPKSILDALTGRVGRFPAMREGGPTWSGIFMDTNPPDSDHWWYTLAEEQKPDGFEFFSQPSGESPEGENIRNLPEGYYQRQKAGKTEEWIKVFVHGEYGFVQDGKPVWAMYRDLLHCKPCDPIPGVPLIIGIDFGLTPAAVICQRTMTGQWRAVDELVCEDMGAKRFGELLATKLRGDYGDYEVKVWGDPAGDSRAQTDETTPFQILRAAGIPARPAPTNDPVKRVEAVSASMNRLIDGEPGFVLDPRCRTLRKAMAGAYRYRRIQLGGTERYHDQPEKNAYSHVADGLQYAMVGGGEAKLLVRMDWQGMGGPARPSFAQNDGYNPLSW